MVQIAICFKQFSPVVISAMKSYTPYFMLLWSAVGIAKAAKIIIVCQPMKILKPYVHFQDASSALHERGHHTVFLLSEGRDITPSNHYSLQRYLWDLQQYHLGCFPAVQNAEYFLLGD